MLLDRIDEVTAARWLVAATSPDDGREGDLVDAYQEDKRAADHRRKRAAYQVDELTIAGK